MRLRCSSPCVTSFAFAFVEGDNEGEGDEGRVHLASARCARVGGLNEESKTHMCSGSDLDEVPEIGESNGKGQAECD